MELKPEQVKQFKELHKDCDGFEKYSEDQIREIANGVANYYLTLFKIHNRLLDERIIRVEDGKTIWPDKTLEEISKKKVL
jgi:uncharacterized protein YdcH (DUF465 family)